MIPAPSRFPDVSRDRERLSDGSAPPAGCRRDVDWERAELDALHDFNSEGGLLRFVARSRRCPRRWRERRQARRPASRGQRSAGWLRLQTGRRPQAHRRARTTRPRRRRPLGHRVPSGAGAGSEARVGGAFASARPRVPRRSASSRTVSRNTTGSQTAALFGTRHGWKCALSVGRSETGDPGHFSFPRRLRDDVRGDACLQSSMEAPAESDAPTRRRSSHEEIFA